MVSSLVNNSVRKEAFASEKILGPLLNTHMSLHNLVYTSTSIILIITSFIFSIISSFILKDFDSLSLFVKLSGGMLALSSLLSLLFCLLILRPVLDSKNGKTDFYYMDVLNRFRNEEDYINHLKIIANDEDKRIKFYIDEYYSLGQQVLLPKFRLIKYSTEILISGLILSAIFFIISLFV